MPQITDAPGSLVAFFKSTWIWWVLALVVGSLAIYLFATGGGDEAATTPFQYDM